jgi:integrase
VPRPIADSRSPYYQYDFQIRKQRFHGSTRCTSERKAQQFIDRLVARINSGEDIKPEITLDAACLAYWNDKGQHEASSATTDYQLANLCSIIGGNKPLSAIRDKDFREFVAKRRASVSPASVNREWQLARRVWKHVQTDYATSDIKWGDLALREPKERVRELNAAEEAKLFDALPESLKPIVEFAILSGQRKSAVVGLRWDKINWREGEATIVNKGGDEHTFPLSPALIHLILEQPQVDGCPFVFTYVCERPAPKRKDRPARRKGERYAFSKQGWDRKWRKAKKDAGIADLKFHDLRHTTATRMLRQTGNIKAAGMLLGHSDTRTTSRYAHVQREDLRALMAESESRNTTGKRLTDEPETRTNPSETEA